MSFTTLRYAVDGGVYDHLVRKGASLRECCHRELLSGPGFIELPAQVEQRGVRMCLRGDGGGRGQASGQCRASESRSGGNGASERGAAGESDVHGATSRARLRHGALSTLCGARSAESAFAAATHRMPHDFGVSWPMCKSER